MRKKWNLERGQNMDYYHKYLGNYKQKIWYRYLLGRTLNRGKIVDF